jgi:hypothetical protein
METFVLALGGTEVWISGKAVVSNRYASTSRMGGILDSFVWRLIVAHTSSVSSSST